MIPINDHILIARLKQNDKTVFSFIFSTFYKDLVLFSQTFTNDLDISEEIVQEVFVDLWENRQAVNITGSLKSFLVKTVQNKSIDWLRHVKVREKYASFVLGNLDLLEVNPDQYLLVSEIEDKIENLLNELPEDIAKTFKMSRFYGMKYHEIAAKLNVSVRTVEDRVSKALVFFRNELKDYLITLAAFVFTLLHI